MSLSARAVGSIIQRLENRDEITVGALRSRGGRHPVGLPARSGSGVHPLAYDPDQLINLGKLCQDFRGLLPGQKPLTPTKSPL